MTGLRTLGKFVPAFTVPRKITFVRSLSIMFAPRSEQNSLICSIERLFGWKVYILRWCAWNVGGTWRKDENRMLRSVP